MNETYNNCYYLKRKSKSKKQRNTKSITYRETWTVKYRFRKTETKEFRNRHIHTYTHKYIHFFFAETHKYIHIYIVLNIRDVCLFACVCVYTCVCVYLIFTEKERERERKYLRWERRRGSPRRTIGEERRSRPSDQREFC